jgi:hypothetical protein
LVPTGVFDRRSDEIVADVYFAELLFLFAIHSAAASG